MERTGGKNPPTFETFVAPDDRKVKDNVGNANADLLTVRSRRQEMLADESVFFTGQGVQFVEDVVLHDLQRN